MSNIDTGLLRALIALVEEEHVSRAAARVGVSQSAMSYSLGRLRNTFDDPILQRTRNGMVATAQARAIHGRLVGPLGEIERLLTEDRGFDPRTSSPSFRIATSGYVAALMMPQILREMRLEAPGCRVEVVPSAPQDTKLKLENNEIDIAIGFWISLSETLMTKSLFDEGLSLIVATSNRTSGPMAMSWAELAEREFAAHTTIDGSLVNYESVFGEFLSRHDVERRIAFRVPNIQVIAPVVATTDMVAVLPTRAAETVCRTLPLTQIRPPHPLPGFVVSATWHARNKNMSDHKWLRQVLERVGKNIRNAPTF